MGNKLDLFPSRGTKLYRNQETVLNIQVTAKKISIIVDMLVIQGKEVHLQKLDLNQTIKFEISPNEEFLFVNLSNISLVLRFDQNLDSLEVVFDPYLYEKNRFSVINIEEITKVQSILDGYVDILPKWYSIKFTYPTKNIIFIRPHLGVSIQNHKKRSEDWKIIQGHPVVIANSRVYYSVNPGDTFHTDKGKLHSIFNPTDNWIVIEETYDGQFEEEDITRVFNPNHYLEFSKL